jgi:acetylornithine/succinyldiaminopimelate/putrescine aminotransferase
MGLEIDKAEGVWLYGPEGQQYLDLISGISVSSLGHRHPAVVTAIREQLDHYMHLMVYGEYIQAPQVKLAEALVKVLPASLDTVYFVNSGSEAIEGAMKLAKRYTGRPEIVAFRNAYHGHTQGAMSIMGGEDWKRPFRPLLPDVRMLEYNDFGQLSQITERTACVVVEVVQAEAGVILAAQGFHEALAARCKEAGALLVYDEVQTGMGRTGRLFAHAHYPVVPDILVLAKAFGGGMPLGAFIASKEMMSVFMDNPTLGHITTFGGHPVSCAAALANLKVISEGSLVQDVAAKEKLFHALLDGQPGVLELRSKGLLMALELGNEARMHRVVEYCLAHGVIVDWFLFCPTAVRIAPPLIITEEEIRFAVGVILEALATL